MMILSRKFKPTKEEQKAIDNLNKLSKSWPKSLWLFSASGTLCVMRTGHNNERIMTKKGGVDQDYVLTSVNIPNDGGDWD